MIKSFENLIQGAQVQLHKLHMFRQVVWTTLLAAACVFTGSFLWMTLSEHPAGAVWNIVSYRKALKNLPVFTRSYIYMADGRYHLLHDSFISADPGISRHVLWVERSLADKAGESVFYALLAVLLLLAYWTRKGRAMKQIKVLSGQTCIDAAKLRKMIRIKGKPSDIKIGNLPIPEGSETRNILIAGTVGTGKSNLIKQLTEQVIRRGDKAVIIDSNNDYINTFYDPQRDVILNPFDERCVNWNLWSECREMYDFDTFANAFIPNQSSDPYWTTSAKTVLAVAAHRTESKSLSELLNLIMWRPLKALAEHVKESAAAGLIDPAAEENAVSIRATMISYTRALEYMEKAKVNGDPFSIKEWIADQSRGGILFISCNTSQRDAISTLMASWLSFAIKGIMELPVYPPRKTWVIIDELCSISELPSLVGGMREIRKHNGVIAVGFQSMSDLEEIYGAKKASTICTLTRTKVVFATPDAQTAKRMSEAIGEQETSENRESKSMGASPVRDGVNLSEHKRQKPIIPYTDFMNLPDLEAVVKVSGNYPVTRVKFDVWKKTT